MQEEWFKNWFDTAYYHELYKNRDTSEASLFIDKLVKKLNPAADSNMLDIGCGKGRHAIQLANLGFDVTGIDLSKASIEEALKQEKDNLHFYQHDMREIFWINYFDYAFNLFTSFGYFNTKRENNNAIQSIAQSLKTGGKLVVDYLNVHFTEQNMVHESKELINNAAYTITRWHDEQKFYKKILIEDPALTEAIAFTEVVSKFTLADFEALLLPHQLKIKDVFGDYQLNSFDEQKSPRLIFVAEKTT
jgi:SAM-dependent methyltransferase